MRLAAASISGLAVLLALACSEPEPGAASAPPAAPLAPSPPLAVDSIPAPPPSPTAEPPVDPARFAAVRRYTEMFYRGEIDALFGRFSDEMRAVLPRDRLSRLRERVLEDYGTERRVIREETQTVDGVRGFARWAEFDGTDEIVQIEWFLKGPDDTIAGFQILPARRKVHTPPAEVVTR